MCTAIAGVAFAAEGGKESSAVQRISEAKTVFQEIMAAGDKGIPHEIQNKAVLPLW